MISDRKIFKAKKGFSQSLISRVRDICLAISRFPFASLISAENQNRLVVALMAAGIISGMATYGAMTETPPFGSNSNAVIWLLNINLVILLLLAAVIGNRLVGLWGSRKSGAAGSHLHVRLVYTFSLLAAAPAIIMTLFSAYFFHFGVQTWFSQRIQTAINESRAVAEAYLGEHQQVIRADTLAMANDLDRQVLLLMGNEKAFEGIMQTQSVIRNLSEAIVFDSSGRVLARSGLTFSLEFDEVPEFALEQARAGEVVITTDRNDDRVRALVKLNNFVDSFLYVGRMVDSKVLSHLNATDEAVKSYKDLESRYSGLQITVNMIFVVVGLLLVFVAIWFGLVLARQLVAPISALVIASERVRDGDLTARVSEFKGMEEFDYLGRSFNRMTSQIMEQQNDLLAANRQLDRRRRLTETVLAGVSSGVVGVDQGGIINLANNSAVFLLGQSENDITGISIFQFFPALEQLFQTAKERPGRIVQAEMPFIQSDESRKIFLVRLVIDLVGGDDIGAILTFDDITELQSAQRKAAWADVARRIAHEIKNPLTPIQLSAERLRRKYLKQITDDPETFSQCTDTIIRHVGDIGRMVNEFSAFARMPEPIMHIENLAVQIRDLLTLQQQAHPEINFEFKQSTDDTFSLFDAQQLRQAITNLLNNAIDAIEAKQFQYKDNNEMSEKGSIQIILGDWEDYLFMSLSDNGVGLPKNEDFSRLTEPYVTYKDKGTGLGLAIVKKIMEDHGGRLILGVPEWLKVMNDFKDLKGATLTLILPRKKNKLDNSEIKTE